MTQEFSLNGLLPGAFVVLSRPIKARLGIVVHAHKALRSNKSNDDLVMKQHMLVFTDAGMRMCRLTIDKLGYVALSWYESELHTRRIGRISLDH